ncbi:organic cation transporter protein-like [Coccinella septempunctata]|uniref:organic cation transporter protein-like n=1 Tax=Coccinella septempunctata TaxID=41139 RepID=UPI001D06FF2F|nr:organic cation transporter protein-like [Coccinella septempunctata]
MMDKRKQRTTPSAAPTEEWLKLTIGDFGKWQCWISFLLSLFKFPIAWIQMSIVFLAPPTQFWCSPPLKYRNMTDEEWLELSKPREFTSEQDHLHNGFCDMKSVDGNNEIIPCPHGFDYNTTVFQTSIITEWDLVCGKERLVDISQVILMTGILIGNILFGLCADRYGRKSILMICVIVQAVFGFVATLSPWFWGFVAARFLVAVANGGTLVVSFVMCIEIVGGKWRAIVPILIQAPFGIGFSMMALFAYYTRDWRQFHYIITVISALFLWYIWLIPESPRWLFVKGRQQEGKKILEKAAKFNGIHQDIFEEKFSKLSKFPTDSRKPSFSDLFKTTTIAKRISLLCIVWFFSGISFFTITQYVGHVGQNIFFSTAVGGLLCIPGQIICLYMISRFGRKNTVAFWTAISAVCFLGIMAFPKGMYPYDWQRMSLAGIAIIGLSVDLCALYLFTGELLPTVVRNTGMGLCSVCSRVGSMLAPLVIALHDTAPFLPLLLLSVFNILLTCLVLLLPETEGKVLPEVIDDLEENGGEGKGKNNNYIEVSTREDLGV